MGDQSEGSRGRWGRTGFIIISDLFLSIAALGAVELVLAWVFVPTLFNQRQQVLGLSGIALFAVTGALLHYRWSAIRSYRDSRSLTARIKRAKSLGRVTMAISLIWLLAAPAPELIPGSRAGFGALQILTAAVGAIGLASALGIHLYLTRLAPVTMPLVSRWSRVINPPGVATVPPTTDPSGFLAAAVQVISDSNGPLFGNWWRSSVPAQLAALSSVMVVVADRDPATEAGLHAIHLAPRCSQGCSSALNLDPGVVWSVAGLEEIDRPVALLRAPDAAELTTGVDSEEIIQALTRNRVPGGFVEIVQGKLRGRTHLSRD